MAVASCFTLLKCFFFFSSESLIWCFFTLDGHGVPGKQYLKDEYICNQQILSYIRTQSSVSSVYVRGILNVGSKSALLTRPWRFLGKGLIRVLCKFSSRLSSISMKKDATLYHCYMIWMFSRYWGECRRALKPCSRTGKRSELPLSLR